MSTTEAPATKDAMQLQAEKLEQLCKPMQRAQQISKIASSMVSSNRTDDFKAAIQLKRETVPNLKQYTRPSNSSSDTWTKEAQLVANNIHELIDFLKRIRRAYLDPSQSGKSGQFTSTTNSNDRTGNLSRGFQGFANVRWFSEGEKDQIDTLVAVGLKKSVQGVRALESAEKSRKAQQDNEQSNPLSRFLGISLSSQSIAKEQFDSHRASILWFLNQRLTDLGKTIKDQQETRAKKKMEKVMKSGLAGLMNAPGTSMGVHSVQPSEKGGVPDIYRPKFDQTLDRELMDEPAIEKVLTSAQIQQFERESSEVLKATQNTLKSIKQTESSLLEISNLQTELVYHLTQQNELIDQLWDDSIISSGKIKQGNQQLLTASESNKESRMWLLVFLLGSSFALLFVDYMAP
ncbi:hypothetical protein Pst134EA_028812 [Puccinia striiformis f. sp. tritici]|uniref:t-SNARE coiled-coil homology domain-containing protein n=2 Tax=Puccinia striiformis TaxID=27350 RepID=A0A0L0W2S2_9BASI|nr:hypothetical protein Pst134EA_028812 [Puccinia striiformis f. sp. tritici]KAI9624654.1 hypothetical protein H4Q26_016718 [Puccinia striiformis f. sp. tritici PST-130]KNF05555.1 hypothetical protein PSTG_01366 [Puccinia striiformis f. sp. tritici PST-78]POV97943.1 hypothetical protein PSHT_14311 [Puccinia striiformis]KAH9440872.1 hypothetical protein Pst134EB_029525 [Puccinia striiformis f. sp. tritici]KAH9446823.1 hypothetical protein Pst134EA_028812 [Puccinia striiformis f. sp. tritici]